MGFDFGKYKFKKDLSLDLKGVGVYLAEKDTEKISEKVTQEEEKEESYAEAIHAALTDPVENYGV